MYHVDRIIITHEQALIASDAEVLLHKCHSGLAVLQSGFDSITFRGDGRMDPETFTCPASVKVLNARHDSDSHALRFNPRCGSGFNGFLGVHGHCIRASLGFDLTCKERDDVEDLDVVFGIALELQALEVAHALRA